MRPTTATPAEKQARRAYRAWKKATQKEQDTHRKQRASYRYRATLKQATPAYSEG